MIWATRGKYWGFRFLRNGGFPDPLVELERAFSGESSDVVAYQRTAETVAIRFQDPLNRKDRSGRVIPHEFVLTGDEATGIFSVEDGIESVWPKVSDYYDAVWEKGSAPEVNGD